MSESEKKKKITIELDQLTIWKFGTFLFGVLFIISWATGGFGTGDDSRGLTADTGGRLVGSGIPAGGAPPPQATSNIPIELPISATSLNLEGKEDRISLKPLLYLTTHSKLLSLILKPPKPKNIF